MKLNIQAIDFEATEALFEITQEKMAKLPKYHPKITSVDVYLSKTADAAGPNQVEIKVFIDGPEIFAQDQSESFDQAIVQAVDKVIRQLKKANPS